MANSSIVGDVINFRGLVYAPVNEMGVVALFAKLCEEMGFIIEEIRSEFPDCIARRQVGRGWERISVEFEYRSSSFRRHRHDPNACDLIVCWEHDWDTCPLPVLALMPYIARSKGDESVPRGQASISAPLGVRKATLTAGGIKNSYLRIGPMDDFWPPECVGGNTERARRHLVVEFEGIGRVSTDISGRHKTFRTAHTQLRAFIVKHRLQPGDEVEILRVGEHEYKVRPATRRTRGQRK